MVERFNGLPLLVVGDLILDRYIWGSVERISPEAPVPVVAVTETDNRLGGAGNVARNLQGLGANVSICGVVGNDDEAAAMFKLFDSRSIEKDGVLIDDSRPTSLKTRVIGHKQQMIRVDREDTETLSPEIQESFSKLVDAKIDSTKGIIISDYAKGVISEPLLKRFKLAHEAGRIGLNTRPFILDPKPPNYALYQNVSVATPNRKEAEQASGIAVKDAESATEAAKIISDKWSAEMVVVTLGSKGLLIYEKDKNDSVHLKASAQEVFDVSGAGDTVIAVLSAGLSLGAHPVLCGELANVAAGIVVGEVGTVSIDAERLIDEIKKYT